MLKIEASGKKSSVCFFCDVSELSGVKKIADKVRLDVERVTGAMPEIQEITSENVLPENSVFFATAGHSAVLDKLAAEGKINLKKISGKREVYAFVIADSKLIIAGSDKRGTIYGLFHLSEMLGVSPLVDWADVLPAHKDSVEFEDVEFISREPSVRFRGFFINDEWPATGNWCNHNFGGFNTKMYEHVFELLLRMKGNYLWPAMWASRFSDDGPGLANAELADELGVVMGASHHEPCCRAGEEYKHLRGPDSIYGDAWNFRSNEAGITKFWEDGLKRNGKFENVITVGMRGEADTAILKNATLEDNIQLLRDVLKTQNDLIRKYVNEDVQQVPRMLALYKEVEPYFYGDKKTKGLMDSPELEGVTLMLCDDNHGNLRTVPTKKMRSHKGGYGMYYHFDYHGGPFSYEWLNTTALPKVKEQMCAAYDFGIRDLWIVNVGDVMTTEFPLCFFLDLAYDYERFSCSEYSVQQYTADWIRRQYPTLNNQQYADVNFIINNYTKVSHMRRTECIQPGTYHPVNFSENDRMLALAQEIIQKAEGLKSLAGTPEYTGLYSQVILPALGNMNVLRMQLYSGKNRWLANKGAVAANWYAGKIKECYLYDQALVDEYDQIADGKFYAEGWSEHFGFTNWCEAASRYPTYTYVEPTRKGRIVFWVEGSEITTTGQDWTNKVLQYDGFKNPEINSVKVYAANCGAAVTPYKVEFKNGAASFLSTEIVKGPAVDEKGVPQIDEIIVTIDREKLAKAAEKKDVLIVKADDGHGAGIDLFVEFDAEVPALNYPEGTFVQTGDYISIEAEHFVTTASTVTEGHFEVLPDYGRTLSAVKAFPVINSYPKGKNAPCVEYKFALQNDGVMSFDFYLNPSNPAYKDNKQQFIAEINGVKILKDAVDEHFAVGDNQEPWGTDITNNIRISTVYGDCKKGLNTLKLYPVTPNIILEKIVIYPVNSIMPDSYLGAPETYRVK